MREYHLTMSSHVQCARRAWARVDRMRAVGPACIALGVAACEGAAVGGSGLGAGGAIDAGPGSPPTIDATPVDVMPTPVPSLYGLAVGNAWAYDLAVPPTTCRIDVTVTGMTEIDGRNAFVVVNTGCNATNTGYMAVEVKDLVEYGNAPPPIAWGHYDPPVDGHTFATNPAGNLFLTWHVTGPQTVPAGTFIDCWTLEVTTSDGTDRGSGTIYCRGVGVIKSFSGSSTQTLISKNF